MSGDAGAAGSRTGTIVVAVQQSLRRSLSSPDTDAALGRLADRLVINDSDEPWTPQDLLDRLDGEVRGLITSWGSPALRADHLDAAPNLEIVGHAAGSVKRLIPPDVWARGVRVTHAAATIAEAVAEYTLAAILTSLRRLPAFHDRVVRERRWGDPAETSWGRTLAGKRVGVVGASQVGRRVIPLLRAFTADLVVYDPYLTADGARDLGVTSVALDELLATSDVVTLHAPILPATHHMIGHAELGRLKPGALLVNSARAWLVDQDALLDVLRDGAVSAVLDVFDEEPLPADSPFRALPNVILTPHVAGRTVDTQHRQLQTIVDEFSRHLSGQPLRFEITAADLERMA